MIYRNVQQFIRAKLNRKKQLFVYSQHKKYIRISAGFDIETTRIENYAYMYHWQISWNDDDLLLRTWADFELLIEEINKWLTPKKAYLLLWVANLGHEFAFLARRFHWSKIFARESHNPLTATTGQVEFRECLSISGQGGLANLAKNYCQTRKLKGDLDYNLIRNSQTIMLDGTGGTCNENGYCQNDVRILSEWATYIFKEFSDNKKDIPLTGTSIVRGDIKAAAESTGCIEQIRQAVYELYPSRIDYNYYMEFLFRGGYTHANIWYVCAKWDNTIGVDFTSSYPYCMLSNLCYYPMTPFVQCNCECNGKEITDSKLNTKCMIMTVDIDNIERTTYHAIESQHKIVKYRNAKFDNGRLYFAEKIRVCLTELDYDVYKRFYKWDKITVVESHCSERGKLPNYVLKPLKHYYIKKQTLKAAGKDNTIEYKNAKARLNAFYGCCVTRLNFTEYKYNQGEPFDLPNGKHVDTGEWYEIESTKTYEKMISKQLLSPFWGIWVTAHARHNLLETVYNLDSTMQDCNVLYCDTDSVYFDDTPRNRAIIAEYNAKVAADNAKYLPDEFKGIGEFEWIDKDKKTGEPIHYEFETLGAKRYLKFYNNHAEITVAGMRKNSYERKLLRTFATENSYPVYNDYETESGEKRKRIIGYVDKNELFDLFTDNFILACDDSDKLASVYANSEYSATVTDYQGHTETMHEKSGVALVPIPFRIKMDDVYIRLLEQILEERRKPCKM